MNGIEGLDDEELIHEEEESFGRPFLGRAMRAETVRSDEASETHDASAAAFGIAPPSPSPERNRKTPSIITLLTIETLLVRDVATAGGQIAWSGQLAMIIAICETPIAVAEVAARVGLPIGVVQVLAGDLVTAGVLLRSSSTMSLADDVLFIERLIHGVDAL